MNVLKNKTKGDNITFKPGGAIIPDFDLVQTKIPIEIPIFNFSIDPTSSDNDIDQTNSYLSDVTTSSNISLITILPYLLKRDNHF